MYDGMCFMEVNFEKHRFKAFYLDSTGYFMKNRINNHHHVDLENLEPEDRYGSCEGGATSGDI